ncbi:MAG TPA: hypothetical protein VIS56_01190, partial [Candidatus Saccharimonadales bacterium]
MTEKVAKAPTQKSKVTKQMPKAEGEGRNSLSAWNLRLGLLLVAVAAAAVVAGGSKTVQLTNQYLAKDTLASEAAGHEVLAAATRHVADVRLSWIIAGFLLAFAVTYLLAATLWQKKYAAWLSRGVNKLRWAGFGVGGGIIVVTLAMLSGVSDISTLALVFGSVVLAGLLAASVELLGSGRRLRRLLAFGAILGVFLPWLISTANISGVVMYDGAVPAYLYYVYASATLLAVAVGLATYFRIKQRGKWAD